ncbi:MAG: NUDIX hydrolase [Nocardioidaceae bacterium]
MSFIRCACGDRHWGPYGAAGLLLTDEHRTAVLLQLRSAHVLSPHTWALPGGALERGETPVEAALREAHEEAGIDVAAVDVTETMPGLVHPQWSYTYVLGTTSTTTLPHGGNWEVSRHAWVPTDQVAGTLALHPSLAADWPRILWTLQA